MLNMQHFSLCLLIASCHILIFTNASVVNRNLPLEVRNGRTIYISKTRVDFKTRPGEVCKIKVVENEPMHQRVGEFTPKIFDCDYLRETIRYEHNGSPFLSEDTVKLVAYRILENKTEQETFQLHVNIVHSECDIIKVGSQLLQVPALTGISNPISKNVVQFNHDRLFDTKCELRITSNGKLRFPESGQLVIPSDSSESSHGKFKPTGTIIMPCDEFLLMGVRYEHLSPPTPDVDYIPLHVIITDKRSEFILRQERHWLPVRIDGAHSNQSPKPSFSNMNIQEVDQFILTNILPMTISATDGETPNGFLIFNVTNPPSEGFITHLDDQTRPDIENLKIAYQPTNASYPERTTFTVEFTVLDSYFSVSKSMKVLLSIRVAQTNAPRISWNMGLTMLEGQSRSITRESLQIVDKDNLDRVRITLAGGLKHGSLYINGAPGYSFSWYEILGGTVVYRHDDTDTVWDFMMFRVSDGIHSTRFKLPITILPKDDSPPVLISNVNFEVQEGQTILIHRFMLEASDQDSSSDYIKFNITRPPHAGQVQKKRKWEKAGWEVQEYKQKDLYQGLIYYKHLGEEAFEDSFDFVMIDSCRPIPNISPMQTVNVKITPVDDLPPKPVPGITRALVVNETDIAFVTSKMLSYIDEEQPGSDIKYSLTSDCHRMSDEETSKESGHLVFTEDMIMLMKDPTAPILKMFSQEAVNHNKVAFMPPMDDIGLKPLSVEFLYSVSDSQGSTLNNERFIITILPVDNQAPHLEIDKLHLKEGGTMLLGPENFRVTDRDTGIYQLDFIITELPVSGAIEKSGQALSVGNSFRFIDIEEFRIIYSHDGSESHSDGFKLVATDGKQNSSVVFVRVTIQPVDDEKPVLKDGRLPLHVREDSVSEITQQHLSATDIDTNDGDIIFEFVNGPKSGSILVKRKESKIFTQQNIMDGDVQYKHGGDEIGYVPAHDTAIFILLDHPKVQGAQLEALDDLSYSEEDDVNGYIEVYELDITILPVNNRPPNLILGSALFQCDEGGRHQLTDQHLMAHDLDSPQENLAFIITSPPNFGYIEDTTPRPGYEKQIGVAVESFKLDRLANGNIYYVQSKHHGIEPTSDQFTVQVTDGKYKSAEVPFLIAILPTNDESPSVKSANFSCTEGGMQTISDNVLSVYDGDFPSDQISSKFAPFCFDTSATGTQISLNCQVTIVVSSPPVHGMLMDEMQLRRRKRSGERHDHSSLTHDMDHVTEFYLDDWMNHLVQPAYLHDGTESLNDNFVLKISDGKHVENREIKVKVISVNDEKPEIITNKEISLELGDSKVISNVALHSRDADTPNDEITYILHSDPHRGILQVKKDDQWIDLQFGDTFTEQDVADNLIRYEHSNVLGTKGRDTFRFSVTDGTFTTNRQNFEIDIKHTQKSMVHVVTNPAQVKEGDKVFITTDVLTARDGSDRPEDIFYEVVTPPMFGRIEYISKPGVSIDIFTQIDLVARKVVYVHNSKEDSAVDLFTIRAGNGIRSQEGVVTLQIEAVDVVLPTLQLFPMGSKPSSSRMEMTHLTMFSGASVTINDMMVSITDPDTAEGNLRLIITKYPTHGNLMVKGEPVLGPGPTEINQMDVKEARFMYQNNGDEALIDRFSFLVTDGVHPGYLFHGEELNQPTVFNIKIESLDETAPVVTLNEIANKIEQLDDGTYQNYAMHIDSHLLRSVDRGSVDPSEIIYSVTEPPSYGYLKLKDSNTKMVDDFTQDDLNNRNVVYVINAKFNVTQDSFVFDVQDDWGNVVMGHRFKMSWARIEMVEPLSVLCESDIESSVTIRRYGNQSVSSFVGIKINPLTATLERDFSPSTARQVQIDPGVSTQKWSFTIHNDFLEERKENFQVILVSPVNAVLSPKRKLTKIVIKDSGSRGCAPSVPDKGLTKLEIVRNIINNKLKKIKSTRRKVKVSRKKKTKKMKKNRQKINRKLKNKKIKFATSQDDEADFDTTLPSRKIKYGKIGPGITVAPASYHRNRTHKVWTYHGLIPITIDEEDEDSIALPEISTKSPINSRGFSMSRDRIINDAPHKPVETESQQNDGELLVTEMNQLGEFESTSTSAVHPPCTISMIDRLNFDSQSGILNRCDGVQWKPWIPSRINYSKRKSAQAECDDDWHKFENNCYYVHRGGTDQAVSWNSAQRQCREEYGGQLATVSSNKHMKWLWKKTRRQKAYIGLNRKLNPRKWEWANGETIAYTNWKKGHPKKKPRPRSILQIMADCTLVTTRKRWIVFHCSKEIENVNFICMKPLTLS